ncbi:MAG: nuclear transport factor 2 family protein [Alphaproteobacteria bacterium]|nr:nuclear transport factor 2 family protein [Alphaproteobacteria bacterium]
MTDKNALIEANEGFYAAFATGNACSMEKLWSRHSDITCIHPGWPPLDGRDDVMGSWQCILSAKSPLIGIGDARVYLYGTVGYVICQEHLERGILIATNIFVVEDGGWKLVHHQAGISPSDTAPLTNEGPQTLQ